MTDVFESYFYERFDFFWLVNNFYCKIVVVFIKKRVFDVVVDIRVPEIFASEEDFETFFLVNTRIVLALYVW